MSVLAVDFGTSNTVAVLSAHDRAPRVVDVDGATAMPSAVFAGPDGLVVGREAERRARLEPARYEANPKRRIDDGQLLLGDHVVPVVDAIAAVLGKVAAETQRQLGGVQPDEVRLTHPAQWGPARRNTLLAAARQAGLGPNLTLVPEPVAAAAHYASFTGRVIGPGEAVAVYDLGAGTFDVAVVGASGTGYTVLAEGGLPDLGGLDVDQALLDHVGGQVRLRDPQGWQRLIAPASTSDRRAARTLREDVRVAKESLSEHPQTELPLPDPFGDVLVTRAELEQLVRPNLARSVELLAVTVQSAGFTPDRLGGIYLVGGSSRIPLVASLITEGLRVVPSSLDQPETAVALGAHHVTAEGVSQRTHDLPPPASAPTPLAANPTAAHAATPQAAGQAAGSQTALRTGAPQAVAQAAGPQAMPPTEAPQTGPNLVAPQQVSQPYPWQPQAPPFPVPPPRTGTPGTALAAGVLLFVLALGFAIAGVRGLTGAVHYRMPGAYALIALIVLAPLAAFSGWQLVRAKGGHVIGLTLGLAVPVCLMLPFFLGGWVEDATWPLLPTFLTASYAPPFFLGLIAAVFCVLPTTWRAGRRAAAQGV